MGEHRALVYSNLGEKQIRLFRLDPNQDDAPLSGSIVTFRHPCHDEWTWNNYFGIFANWKDTRLTEKSGDEFGYDALSYTWGADKAINPLNLSTTGKVYKKGKLHTDGNVVARSTMYIPTNLRTLLLELRRVKYDRFIWIDSICIAQDDLAEKSAQIPLMRHIYKEAKNVLVWLGEASEAEEGALTIMPALTAIFKKNRAEGPEIHPDTPGSLESIGLPEPSHLVWPALGTIMNRPWFRRLWTLQEVVLPETEKIVVLCGRRRISWETLKDFGLTLLNGYKQRIINWTITGNQEVETPELNGYTAIRMVDDCRTLFKLNVFGVPLSTLLLASRRRKATIPIDMIFGMLGMAPPGLSKQLQLDQSLSPIEVFITFARHYLRNEVYECLLNHTASRDRMPQLPSWCPNFGSTERACCLGSLWYDDTWPEEAQRSQRYCAGFTKTGKYSIPIIDHYIRNQFSNGFHQRADNQGLYDTPDPRQLSLMPDPHLIRASGMIVDTISQIVPYNDGVHDFATSVSSVQKTYAWEAVCSELAKETLRSAEPVPEAYWRTLLANQTGGTFNGQHVLWDRFEKVDMLQNYHIWKRHMEKSIEHARCLSLVTCLEHRSRWFCMQALKIFNQRCFFATRNGRIGLGPSSMKVGDQVCVFFYCPTPYILRPRPPCNEFVGEVYVHGLMYGQALDMLDRGELQETQFVLA